MNWVYAASFGDEFIKIGTTADVWRRMRSFRNELRRELSMLYVTPGTYALEGRLLKRFDHLHSHLKEWFRAEPELLTYAEKHMTPCDNFVRRLMSAHADTHNLARPRHPFKNVSPFW